MTDPQDLRRQLRARFNLHVGEHVAAYLAGRLASRAPVNPVLAQDARTGRAVRLELPLGDLAAAPVAPAAAAAAPAQLSLF